MCTRFCVSSCVYLLYGPQARSDPGQDRRQYTGLWSSLVWIFTKCERAKCNVCILAFHCVLPNGMFRFKIPGHSLRFCAIRPGAVFSCRWSAVKQKYGFSLVWRSGVHCELSACARCAVCVCMCFNAVGCGGVLQEVCYCLQMQFMAKGFNIRTDDWYSRFFGGLVLRDQTIHFFAFVLLLRCALFSIVNWFWFRITQCRNDVLNLKHAYGFPGRWSPSYAASSSSSWWCWR